MSWEEFLSRTKPASLISYETRFEWGVAVFGAGIALYFALSFEPNLLYICILTAGIAALHLVASRKSIPWASLSLIALLFLGGLLRSGWHTQSAATPILPQAERAYWVTGWIAAVEPSGSRLRWRINVSDIAELDLEDTPVFIRTTVTPGAFKAGDAVKIRAVLSAPKGPAVPGGYNPAKRAFFEQIGGFGYAISKPKSATLPALSTSEQFSRSIVRWRYHLADRILVAAPKSTAGLQVALLTGIRTYIPNEQTDALRAAGLAHILAISGLHMGLVVGTIFAVVTFLLACITRLSRRMDVRKPAALAAAMAGTAYLVLSGASVATQRAYIMAMIVFLAVLLDRRAFSMRSVALAAAITLLIHPEALVSAGFQMSFAAVAALIAVYRWWDSHRKGNFASSQMGRLWTGFLSLSVTSFVAGFATAGYAALHFNRIATFGLAGNLLAMPIFTFWVMPTAILVFLALPFGLEGPALFVMGQGLEIILRISDSVAEWPGAVTHVVSAPPWVFAIYSFGFLSLCLGPSFFRALGLISCLIGLSAWIMVSPPDMRISDTGRVAVWTETDPPTLLVDRRSGDRYGREQFIRRSGQTDVKMKTFAQINSLCDTQGCRIFVKGRIISILSTPAALTSDCETADIIIVTRREAGPVSRRRCQAIIIDERSLSGNGAHTLRFTDKKIEIKTALTPKIKNRPWGQGFLK